MKSNLLKTFAAVVCLIVFASMIHAQEKPRAESSDKLEAIDAFGLVGSSQIRGRMDIFMKALMKNPAAKGFIINYGSHRGGAKSLAARNALLKERLTLRKFDLSRIEFIDGGYLEEPATELWISTDDNQKPVPTLVDENPSKNKTAAKKATRRKSK